MRITVSAKQLVMPSVCACCGGSSETTRPITATRIEGKRKIRVKSSVWNVPFCRRCVAHDETFPSASPVEILILTLLTVGLYLYFYFKRRQRAFAMCSASCAPPRRSIAYLGWHGTMHYFEVAREPFAIAFMVANEKKLAEVDPAAMRLLKDSKEQARAKVPTPASNTTPRQRVATPPQNAAPKGTALQNAPFAYAASRQAAVPRLPQVPDDHPFMFNAVSAPDRVAEPVVEAFYGPNAALTIAGRTLTAPLVYAQPSGESADASTIITSLPFGRVTLAEPLPYWPSYADASPSQRSVYLEWLAGGRSTAGIELGYVFLYFYGLERRLLVDRADQHEVRAEVKRLLAIYGAANMSFRTYASSLLAFTTLPALNELSEFAVYSQLADLAADSPTALAGLLAWFQVQKRPLPTRCAMIVSEQLDGAKGGAVVVHARAELEELFAIRYRERFGDGLVPIAAQRPQVVEYRPASPSFRNAAQLRLSIPHVLGRPTQFKPLVELWNDCVAGLRKLVAARQKLVDSPMTVEAWSALPPELRRHYDHPDKDNWDQVVSALPQLGAFRLITAGELAKLARIDVQDHVTAARLRRAVETAALLGYAVEPDARIGNASVAASAALAIWSTKATTAPDAKLWRSIHTILSLTLSVAAADGVIDDEEAHTVHVLIEDLFALDEVMRTRVAALRWILTRQPGRATAIAKRLKETRSASELAKIGRVLVAVAAVDGKIVDREHKVLQSLYRAMGLAPSELAGAIIASGARLGSDETVVARSARREPKGELIPAKPESTKHGLDATAIAALLEQTREVAMLLAEVFDEEGEPAEPAPPSDPVPPVAEGPWSTLDARYHVALRELITKEAWTTAEVRTIAARSRLMPGAILEAINTWSEERYGDQVIEEAGDWRIHAEILERPTA